MILTDVLIISLLLMLFIVSAGRVKYSSQDEPIVENGKVRKPPRMVRSRRTYNTPTNKVDNVKTTQKNNTRNTKTQPPKKQPVYGGAKKQKVVDKNPILDKPNSIIDDEFLEMRKKELMEKFRNKRK